MLPKSRLAKISEELFARARERSDRCLGIPDAEAAAVSVGFSAVEGVEALITLGRSGVFSPRCLRGAAEVTFEDAARILRELPSLGESPPYALVSWWCWASELRVAWTLRE